MTDIYDHIQNSFLKFKSEQYEGFQQQLKELIAERSVK